MSYKKIDQYLLKAHNYATLNIVQSNMKKPGLSKTIMDRVNSKFAKVAK